MRGDKASGGVGKPPLSQGSCRRPHSPAGYIVLELRYYSGFVSPYMTLNASYKTETQNLLLINFILRS
ncbi:hypothetical protein E2C01_027157 [Portunus trituberculatus]|uniref:Uncharacterized protein n=1 Tax=Portunus trituberculatus TaxID=210409 RepID=A0A5B7EN06_PORTR|nr:hypothetical protein [Portunus trituberculatus]